MTDVVGKVPYRLALAGGWIDQPFVSGLLSDPPGSMVTVCVEPRNWFMERSGLASGTRVAAQRLWGDGGIPVGDKQELVRELYAEENRGRAEPSGSQDMIGLIYNGICRLDYDVAHEGGVFPVNIEQCCDQDTAEWFENVINILPVAPRPSGYNPLEEKNLTSELVGKLGQSGGMCYDAIVCKDAVRLGESMNSCMEWWEALLPNTVNHKVLQVDLKAVMRHYQERYDGAMFSGCGGGYLYIVSEKPVPGTFKVKVRL
jgi:hypothetical protein